MKDLWHSYYRESLLWPIEIKYIFDKKNCNVIRRYSQIKVALMSFHISKLINRFMKVSHACEMAFNGIMAKQVSWGWFTIANRLLFTNLIFEKKRSASNSVTCRVRNFFKCGSRVVFISDEKCAITFLLTQWSYPRLSYGNHMAPPPAQLAITSEYEAVYRRTEPWEQRSCEFKQQKQLIFDLHISWPMIY